MRTRPKTSSTFLLLALLVGAPRLIAQEVPDSARADTLAGPQAPDSARADRPVAGGAAADSAARAERDSLEAEIARELGADTAAAAPAAPVPPRPVPQVVSQAAGQIFNPDISVIGDFLSDLSPERSSLEGGDRFQMREVELGFQSVVDPYFRADFFIALKEGVVELEEGYLTTLALPRLFQAKLGRFHLPYGKVNLTHRPELRMIEYPRAIQGFFGDDGFASSGLWVSKIFAPLGFYQELIGVIGNDLGEGVRGEGEEGSGEVSGEGEGGEDGEGEEGDAGEDLLDDLGNRLFLGHLKNYVDLTEAANLEVGLSAATGEDRPGEPEAARLTFYGIDVTYRWRPPAAALYRSLVLQAEATFRDARSEVDFGGFLFAQYQLGRRWYVGTRYDYVEAPIGEPTGRENSISGYVTLVPSEFSLFRLGYEHRAVASADDLDRVLVQVVVTLGPHRPHPF